MTTWIYVMPGWLFAICAIVVACALTACGLLLVRHFGNAKNTITHNDVAGPIVGTAGTILAVVLSFMVVVVWQEYDASAANVQREASAIADLRDIASALPSQSGLLIRGELSDYAVMIVRDEWPRMQHGDRSTAAHNIATQVERAIVTFVPKSAHDATLQAEALSLVRTFADARRQRLFDNSQGIPRLMWASMLFLSAITIGFTYLFRVDRFRIHLLMSMGLAAIIACIFVLIAELDYPFRGDLSISPQAFQTVIGVRASTDAIP